MARNYYSKKRIDKATENTLLNKANYPTEKIMKNAYIHTGIYNFLKVAEQQEKALPITLLRDQMLKKFNEEIAKSITRENEIYRLREVNGPNNLQKSLSLSSFGERVWDSLNLYTLIDELVEVVLKDGSATTDEKGTNISADHFNETLQNLFNEKIQTLKKDYDIVYSELFDSFEKEYFVKTKAKEKVYLETLVKSPLAYFSTLSSYQGAVGEFATLLDNLIFTSIDNDQLITELFQKGLNSKNIKVAATQGKSDISVNSIGLSVKNYKINSQENYNVSLHSGKALSGVFGGDFSEIVGEENFNIEKILKENNYTWDIKDYFSYMFANLYTFKNIGGYSTVAARKEKSGQNFIKKDMFSQYSFITDFLKYTTIYWIGEKILKSYSKAGQNTDPVAFLVLNKKMIPVSKILIAIRDDLNTAVPELSFSGNVSFNPNVLRQKKYRVIKQLKKNESKKFSRRYPDALLQIGSTMGKAIINNVKFGIRLKIDYNAF